jgi:1-aminocyclopropane-1-carboxylate deaminase/D-cysteine desulfhydrase-like pyridoxal-dependent ACC family enzyme
VIDFHSFLNLPSPLQLLDDDRVKRKNIKLYVKRDDLIHPSVGGNKFRKMKYNLLKMNELGFKKMITFGGAFSNHIYSVAAIGKILNIKTIGIIRGERSTPLSSTLAFAENSGMQLFFYSREIFKNKTSVYEDLKLEFYDAYWLPEGGSNALAVEGCKEIVPEVNTQLGFKPEYYCVACGTGGTLAGIARAIDESEKLIGFSILKNENLVKDINALINTHSVQNVLLSKNISIINEYHFGGYAKWQPELIHFINDFKRKHDIALDPIYTGKMFYGLFDLIDKDYFPTESVIVAVHTGGLQGIEGFNQLKLKNTAIKIE